MVGVTDTWRISCCGSSVSAALLTPEGAVPTWQAFRLEWLTVAWMIVEEAAQIFFWKSGKGPFSSVGGITLSS